MPNNYTAYADLTVAKVMDLIAINIQQEAEKSHSVLRTGSGVIVVEIVPILEGARARSSSSNTMVHTMRNWLGLSAQHRDVIAITKTYKLLADRHRHTVENGEMIDRQKIAYEKIAILKHLRLDDENRHIPFGEIGAPDNAGHGRVAQGAVLYRVQDGHGCDLMEIYVAVSGSPYEDEEQHLALAARDVLEATLGQTLGCTILGAYQSETPK